MCKPSQTRVRSSGQSACWVCTRPWAQSLALHKVGTSTQSHPQLHSELEASLSCHKRKQINSCGGTRTPLVPALTLAADKALLSWRPARATEWDPASKKKKKKSRKRRRRKRGGRGGGEGREQNKMLMRCLSRWGTCHQVWLLEVIHQNPHGRKRTKLCKLSSGLLVCTHIFIE